MSYKLLARKLGMEKGKIIVGNKIKGYCRSLHLNYYSAIGYLLSNGYIVRVLRGIFYIKSTEERKLKKEDMSYADAIREALSVKGVKNWYFGLETALKLNNLTHEYFSVDFIISDSISRPKPFEIFGHKIKFLKAKKGLFGFGVKNGDLPHSDIEKTVLDMAYFGKYNGLSDARIKDDISPYIKNCSKKKLMDYSKKYPKTVIKIIKGLA